MHSFVADSVIVEVFYILGKTLILEISYQFSSNTLQ